jgi:mRNA interferase RelE/StbE
VYKVQYKNKALKQLKKLDKFQSKIIIDWIESNLVNCDDPRAHGKGLIGDYSSEWRYRVGDYRVLANISDTDIIIHIVKVGHRKDIYRQ